MFGRSSMAQHRGPGPWTTGRHGHGNPRGEEARLRTASREAAARAVGAAGQRTIAAHAGVDSGAPML
jgi:hypothetical protein